MQIQLYVPMFFCGYEQFLATFGLEVTANGEIVEGVFRKLLIQGVVCNWNDSSGAFLQLTFCKYTILRIMKYSNRSTQHDKANLNLVLATVLRP